MSDLQCAARILVGSTTGSAAADWHDRLSGERVAAVYAVDGTPHAADLSRRVGGASLSLTEPVTVQAVLARQPDTLAQLRDIADLHRGETVLVLAADDIGRGSLDDRTVTVLVDGDGIVVRELRS